LKKAYCELNLTFSIGKFYGHFTYSYFSKKLSNEETFERKELSNEGPIFCFVLLTHLGWSCSVDLKP